ncbi:charged multivesicular body protein 2A [Schistosoma bovis]|uniref:Charged multivesicular body protein 2A n=1 Tax=Schistosoma bovis TaxID=6184 RepID=A0A430Q622_SCHBO|nr:charged multivesicular body protein 2A [Schistosoma bovis]
MSFLFGTRKTPEEQLRDSKRTIARTLREIDREKTQLERERVRITNEIRALAKRGQIDAVKALSMKIQTLKSTATMASAMKQVALTMRKMNSTMQLPQFQKIMMEFEKQTETMEMKQDMMSDVIDDAIGDQNDIEDSETVVNKVLEELGIDLNAQLSNLPTAKDTIGSTVSSAVRPHAVATDPTPVAGPGPNSDSVDPIDENNLEARLERLKRK